MKAPLIALALALSARPVLSNTDGWQRVPHCMVFVPNDTLNVRSLPDGKVIVNEFTHGTKVWIFDTKLVNGHPWAFATEGPETNPAAGWVYAEYLTRCE